MNRAAPAWTTGLLLLAVIQSACAAQTTAVEQAGRALVDRLLPDHCEQIIVEQIDKDNGRDVFELQTKDGKLMIRGSNGAAIAGGLHHYLKLTGAGHLSWSGDRIALSVPPAPIDGLIRKVRPHQIVHHFNYTAHGYTTPYWNWKRWRREIDFLAAHGVNQVMLTVGVDHVYVETLKQFGYNDFQARHWISLPAHQPWQWMGNMHSAQGRPLNTKQIHDRLTLGQKIIARMKELGMTPVLPGFYGIVPTDFASRHPASRPAVRQQGQWAGGYERPALLNPSQTDPFDRVADVYYQNLRTAFGDDITHISADPFHEGGISEGVDVPVASKNIHQAMLRSHPEAVWVLMAWQGNPRAAVLQGLVNKEQALVLDLWGDVNPTWDNHLNNSQPAFHNVPWVWSIIQNFGGKTGLSGNLQRIVDQYKTDGAFHHPQRGRLKGLSITMEGTDQNPVVMSLMGELAWRDPSEGPIDLDQWILQYADQRYGRALQPTRDAWLKIKNTAYQHHNGQGTAESLIAARPNLNAVNASTWGPPYGPEQYYDPKALEQALGRLLEARDELKDVSPYQYDLADVARQVLANRARAMLGEIRGAYQAKQLDQFVANTRAFLELIKDQDRLLASREEFLVGRWIQDARRWGDSRKEQDNFERDARMILTTWTDRDSNLHDYAHREWAGLVGDLYHARWKAYFDHLAGSLKGVKTSAPDFFKIEWAWVQQTDPDAAHYPATPTGDPVEISRSLYEKYVLDNPAR